MVVTRSRNVGAKAIGSETSIIKETITKKKVTKSKASTNISTTIKIKKPKIIKKPSKHIEDLFAHIHIPLDLELPQSFANYHDENFIRGINHIIKIDPSLYPSIIHRNFETFKKGNESTDPLITEGDIILNYWYSLISSVIGQQISGSAAKSVENKFRASFGTDQPTPRRTLAKNYDQLRSVGLSNQKVGYVISISESFTNPLNLLTQLQFYKTSNTETIIEELIKLKGIGSWSAKMFCFFTLKDLDVFAEDDLGVARGVSRYLDKRPELCSQIKQEVNELEHLQKLLGKKAKFDKANSKRDWKPYHDQYVIHLGSKFKPFRLVLMLIMWRLSSTNVEVLENYGVRSGDLEPPSKDE